jgi:signal transduction histidine kinase
MINTTEHAVRKMSNLVDHIRKPAIEDDSQQLPINLTQLVEELIADHQHRLPAPSLDGRSPQVMIRADSEQLRSVLGHLIQNAQDATPPDGEIALNLKIAKGNVVLFIQDTGSGMTEEFIKGQLFKPFESAKGLTGMGIGAYQAREYIQKIGGSIDVTSEPGLGSCFSVRIPLAEAKLTQLPETPFRSVSGAESPTENAN